MILTLLKMTRCEYITYVPLSKVTENEFKVAPMIFK